MISTWPGTMVSETVMPLAIAMAAAVVPNLTAIALSVSPAWTTWGRGVAAGVGESVGAALDVGTTVGDPGGLADATAVGEATWLAETGVDPIGVGVGGRADPPPRTKLPARTATTSAATARNSRPAPGCDRRPVALPRPRHAGSGSTTWRVRRKATSGATLGRPLDAASRAVRAPAKRSQRACASVRHSWTWRCRARSAGGRSPVLRYAGSQPSKTAGGLRHSA